MSTDFAQGDMIIITLIINFMQTKTKKKPSQPKLSYGFHNNTMGKKSNIEKYENNM